MAHTRTEKPQTTFFQQLTTSLINKTLQVLTSQTHDGKKEKKPFEDIPNYHELKTSQFFSSEKAYDSTEYSREIKAATELALKHPKRKAGLLIGSDRGLIIFDPVDLKNIIKSNDKNLASEESVSLFARSFGNNVIMAKKTTDPDWRPMRNEFTSRLFDKPAMIRNTQTIKDILSSYIKKIPTHKPQMIDIEMLANQFTLDMIIQGLLKIDKDNVSEKTKARLAAIIEAGVDEAVKLNNVALMSISNLIPLSSDAKVQAGMTLIKDEIITPNKQQLEKSQNWVNMRQHQLQKTTGKKLDLDSPELIREIEFLLTAGHDTTAKHFMFTFLLVSKHPEVLKKIVAEVKSLNKQPDDWTLDDIKAMNYLDCVILESLRLCPPLPIQKTKVANEFKTHDGITLKPGDHIFIHVGATHRLPEIYPKPLEFNPDRFKGQSFDQFVHQALDEKSPYSFAWMPFGYGARSCPGRRMAMQEVKLALAYFAYFFNMQLTHDWQLDQVRTTFGSKPDIKEGLEVAITAHSKLG